ncbi:MAG: prepilin-type N-terminal cleavage/methylation domain-containing protein [Fimbriimonas sp.]|nr:prepilin-type N-terminal cleavage/methylation domain-containing protein [Fimbriimonas sp.]
MVRRAFTLIELLVVIAIIAILASILFPVFAQAKAAAKHTQSLSNTKQMTLGVMQYLGDNDDISPLSLFYTPSTGAWSGASVTTPADVFGHTPTRDCFWSNSIAPYIKNYQIYTTALTYKDRSDVFGVSLTAAQGYTYSLTYNGYLNQWPQSSTVTPAGTILFSQGLGIGTMPRYANEFPLMISAAGWEGMFIADDGGKHCVNAPWGYSFNFDASWWVYSRGSDYSFMDGHSKYIVNPSAKSPWASTDSTGIGQEVWVDGTAANDGCAWWYYYSPTITN